jgi:hypothetical protein
MEKPFVLKKGSRMTQPAMDPETSDSDVGDRVACLFQGLTETNAERLARRHATTERLLKEVACVPWCMLHLICRKIIYGLLDREIFVEEWPNVAAMIRECATQANEELQLQQGSAPYQVQDPFEVHSRAFRDTFRRICETLCQCERCLTGTRHERLQLTPPDSDESVLADDPVTRRHPIREQLSDEARRNSMP